MSLKIHKLQLLNFRNYESLVLDDLQQVTAFVGHNAVGKTNIIEAIQLITSFASFRHPKLEYLVREGAPHASVHGVLCGDERMLDIRMNIEPGHKEYLVNGKRKAPADLKSLLPSVIFTPDDLELVKGAPGTRRRELDTLGSQLSANHYTVKKDYESVLKHKNKLLKDEESPELIKSINEMMITCGAQLSFYRAALVRKLNPYLKEAHERISFSRETLELVYIPSWEEEVRAAAYCTTPIFTRDEARAHMQQVLNICFDREVASHRSLVGPHLDNAFFKLNGKDASIFGSQGQQRSIVLALKIAELSMMQDILHQKPVLLLDDVMSELDETRRSQLVSFIKDDMQVFITATTQAYFSQNLLPAINIVNLPLEQGNMRGR